MFISSTYLSTSSILEYFTIFHNIESNLLWVKTYLLRNLTTTLYKTAKSLFADCAVQGSGHRICNPLKGHHQSAGYCAS
jgi:hypothetical protein